MTSKTKNKIRKHLYLARAQNKWLIATAKATGESESSILRALIERRINETATATLEIP